MFHAKLNGVRGFSQAYYAPPQNRRLEPEMKLPVKMQFTLSSVIVRLICRKKKKKAELPAQCKGVTSIPALSQLDSEASSLRPARLHGRALPKQSHSVYSFMVERENGIREMRTLPKEGKCLNIKAHKPSRLCKTPFSIADKL